MNFTFNEKIFLTKLLKLTWNLFAHCYFLQMICTFCWQKLNYFLVQLLHSWKQIQPISSLLFGNPNILSFSIKVTFKTTQIFDYRHQSSVLIEPKKVRFRQNANPKIRFRLFLPRHLRHRRTAARARWWSGRVWT